MVTENLIETTPAERIAAYQRGWNDAACGRPRAKDQPIMYAIGFQDSFYKLDAKFKVQS